MHIGLYIINILNNLLVFLLVYQILFVFLPQNYKYLKSEVYGKV